MTKILFMGQGQGRSMQPLINEGDKLYVEKVKLKDLKRGDIAVFYQNKNFVGHRIITIKNSLIITKGDNSSYFDKPLKFQEILGKVVKIEGKYGRLNLYSPLYRFFSNYFLFYNYAAYYLPLWFRTVLMKTLRGRKILVRILAVFNFSK